MGTSYSPNKGIALALAVVLAVLHLSAGTKFVAYSMLTHDGRRMVSHVEGTNTVYELVPTNRLPDGLPPPREWKLYGLGAGLSILSRRLGMAQGVSSQGGEEPRLGQAGQRPYLQTAFFSD